MKPAPRATRAKRKQRPRARLGKDDWAEAALAALATGGVAAVAIEPIARTLKTTKGSCYWHFTDRDALLRAACERWESDVGALLEQFDAAPTPRARLEALIGMGALGAPYVAVEAALHDAASDPVVAPILRRVRERRIAFMRRAYRRMGVDAVEARALLAYAAYVGLLHLYRHGAAELGAHEPKRFMRLMQQIGALIIPEDVERTR